MQVTAFGIIGSNGQMGLLPTGVQFGFGDSTAGAVIQPGTGSTTASSSELAVVRTSLLRLCWAPLNQVVHLGSGRNACSVSV